ncbi:Alpha-amanitin target protein [Eptesipox virus]|uniref:Alpha-amanitin target protein n=1 Tax=Eptesipox virus TaxID=1329402 RepID=A0A220T6M1_9POXV|nr:Alpha-amanitin target protein [Eptesipox virus]ASK51371.1 Alpha-amanitin target protein [Eptesipox virus]WAH71129.1 alpha-amanitin target protein [Eptesipox virus]
MEQSIDNVLLIKKYVKMIKHEHYNEFVSIFKTIMNFAKYDRDPYEDEIIYILTTEEPTHALHIIDYIIKRITYCYITYISKSLKETYNLSFSMKCPFNDLKNAHLFTSVKNVNINDFLAAYFDYRSKKISGCVNSIFNELFTYDILARYYYGNDYIKNTIKQLSNNDNYVFTFYKRTKRTVDGTFKVDIETIKRFIGFIAILFEHVPNLNKLTFFDNVSFFHRMDFKQYLVKKYN